MAFYLKKKKGKKVNEVSQKIGQKRQRVRTDKRKAKRPEGSIWEVSHLIRVLTIPAPRSIQGMTCFPRGELVGPVES